MILPIRYYGDPILRRVARPVRSFDDSLRGLVADMVETMYAANGIGLAAPQIGVSLRLFIALETEPGADDADGAEAPPTGDGEGADAAGERAEPVDPDRLTVAEKRERWRVVAEHVMVNPEIVARDGTQYGADGCLSIPGLFVDDMERDFRVRIRYHDAHGDAHELDAEGRFAHVLQHEYDHLDGVLFFDRLASADRRAFLEEHRSELAAMQRDAKSLLRELRRDATSA